MNTSNDPNAKLLGKMVQDHDEKKERSLVARATRVLDRTIFNFGNERNYPGQYGLGGRNEW